MVLLLGVDLGGDSKAALGGVMVVLAGLGYALAGFIVKRRFKGVQPVGLVAGTTLSSAIAAAAPLRRSARPRRTGPASARWPPLTVLGVAGTGHRLRHLLHAARHAPGPAKASLVAYVAPGFSVVYGVAFLSESFTVTHLRRAWSLILVGSWLAAGRTRPAPAEATCARLSPRRSPPADRRRPGCPGRG